MQRINGNTSGTQRTEVSGDTIVLSKVRKVRDFNPSLGKDQMVGFATVNHPMFTVQAKIWASSPTNFYASLDQKSFLADNSLGYTRANVKKANVVKFKTGYPGYIGRLWKTMLDNKQEGYSDWRPGYSYDAESAEKVVESINIYEQTNDNAVEKGVLGNVNIFTDVLEMRGITIFSRGEGQVDLVEPVNWMTGIKFADKEEVASAGARTIAEADTEADEELPNGKAGFYKDCFTLTNWATTLVKNELVFKETEDVEVPTEEETDEETAEVEVD